MDERTELAMKIFYEPDGSQVVEVETFAEVLEIGVPERAIIESCERLLGARRIAASQLMRRYPALMREVRRHAAENV